MDPSLIDRLREQLAPDAPGGLLESATPLDVRAIAEVARAHDARFAALAGPASKAELLDALHDGLAFPDYDGRNWDALEEILLDPAASGRSAVVAWSDPGRLPRSDAGVFRDIVAAAAGDRRADRDGPLVVVVGPAVAEEKGVMADIPGKVHHVALVVRSIEESLGLWRDTLRAPLETVMDIEHDRVRIAFLGVGESKIELVEPTDDTTGVARFLATKGEGFHHVCLEVANLAETLVRLEIDGIELIDTAPRRGAEGPVAFIHPRSCHGVLVELIEAPGGPAWAALGFT